MKFIIEINTDSAAFNTIEDETFLGADGTEVAAILRSVADRVESTRLGKGAGGPLLGVVRDINGNRVGHWRTTQR